MAEKKLEIVQNDLKFLGKFGMGRDRFVTTSPGAVVAEVWLFEGRIVACAGRIAGGESVAELWRKCGAMHWRHALDLTL